jgi:hypothetical protein
MDTRPPRALGFAIGILLVLFFVFLIGASVFQMSTGELSIWLVLWVMLPLISLPLLLLTLYRLYGLFTARYSIDRNGLRVRWGLAYDDIPIHQLVRVEPAEAVGLKQPPPPGFWWPGLVIGKRKVEGLGEVEYFAARAPSGLLVVQSGDRFLAISPSDADAFIKAVTDSLRMGALQTHEEIITRPNFALARLGADRAALLLVVIGSLLPIAMFVYLLLTVGDVPGQVTFGFDATGVIDTYAPPGRLLLLPMIGGASWFVNLFFGLWMYRTDANRPLAYALWAGAILVGGLLWGAVLQLMGVA